MAFKAQLMNEVCDKCGKSTDERALALTVSLGHGRHSEYHNICIHPSCFNKVLDVIQKREEKEREKEADGILPASTNAS